MGELASAFVLYDWLLENCPEPITAVDPDSAEDHLDMDLTHLLPQAWLELKGLWGVTHLLPGRITIATPADLADHRSLAANQLPVAVGEHEVWYQAFGAPVDAPLLDTRGEVASERTLAEHFTRRLDNITTGVWGWHPRRRSYQAQVPDVDIAAFIGQAAADRLGDEMLEALVERGHAQVVGLLRLRRDRVRAQGELVNKLRAFRSTKKNAWVVAEVDRFAVDAEVEAGRIVGIGEVGMLFPGDDGEPKLGLYKEWVTRVDRACEPTIVPLEGPGPDPHRMDLVNPPPPRDYGQPGVIDPGWGQQPEPEPEEGLWSRLLGLFGQRDD